MIQIHDIWERDGQKWGFIDCLLRKNGGNPFKVLVQLFNNSFSLAFLDSILLGIPEQLHRIDVFKGNGECHKGIDMFSAVNLDGAFW